MSDTIECLRRQIAEAEENLRLIQERRSEYVLEPDIPLQLVKQERRLEAEIPRLRERLAELAQAQLDADMDELRVRRDQKDEARREMRERQHVVNLRPLDVTHTFKDRVREMQELCEHLADGSVRLVSVVGRAGMGKTALASRVLGDLEQGVLPVPGEGRGLPVDGILYLSARSTGLSLERIYADVGRMHGEPIASRLATRWTSDAPVTAKVEYLLETMQDGLYIILLDNLEDLLAEDGTIAEEDLRLFVDRCLTQPGGAQLVATSRDQIKVTAAALHGARSIPLREGLPEDEAIALLRDLDPQGELGLSDAPKDQLRRVVQLTQGIPRALEILAGILHEDPTASLTGLLEDEQLFEGQVVEQLVAEGYRRLGEDERRVTEALAVFDRPVQETAIAFLLHAWWPGLDVRAVLRRLARGYFVSVSRTTGEYSLHPVDREYAYSQLPADGEGSEYTRRNLELRAAGFYANIRKPESEWQTIDDLEPQLNEFEHRFRAGDYDSACRVLDTIDFDYLFLWGHCTLLINLREKLLEGLTDPALQAANLNGLGLSWHALGQVKRAAGLYDDALIIARENGERRMEGVSLGNLGSAHRDLGRNARAAVLYAEALEIAREVGDRRLEGTSLGNLGSVHHNLGEFDLAIEHYDEALEIYRDIDDHRRRGSELGNLGNTFRAVRQLKRAMECYEEALTVARTIGDRWAEGVHLGRLGVAYRDLGMIKQAADCHEEARRIAHDTGHLRVEGRQLGRLGIIHYLRGEVDQAVRSYIDARRIARQTGDRRYEGAWALYLGRVYQSAGRIRAAIRFYEKALAITREIGDRRGESHPLLGLSSAFLAADQLAEAQERCREALDLHVTETNHRAMFVLGTVLLRHREKGLEAGQAFADSVARCRAILSPTEDLFEPRYALAAALVGQAVCDPHWPEVERRADLFASVLAEYRRALEITSARGIVQDALRDLELIRAAGIEGLEPVFELLESALV